MEENDMKGLMTFLKDDEVKIVWREEDRTKVGRGKITNDDENFVYLTGDIGTVIVNKKDIIIGQQMSFGAGETTEMKFDPRSSTNVVSPGAGNHTYKVQIRHHLSASYANRLLFNRSSDGTHKTISTLTCSEIEI